MFTARYALSPYLKQTRFVFKGLIRICPYSLMAQYSACGMPPIMCRLLTVVRNHGRPQDFFYRSSKPKKLVTNLCLSRFRIFSQVALGLHIET
jgi:hypothetical protein